jgi:membrane associated rhomboid family serine protease
MILPFNDTEKTRYGDTPMTVMIIMTCTLIWLIQEFMLHSEYDFFVYLSYLFLGTSPKLTLDQQGLGGITSLTAAFLHGGFSHLFFNMWALWVFGRRVEDACGTWRFLAFYLFCAATSDIAFTVIHADSYVPAIGASGAIYGVMAAYLILYPEGRIRTLVLVPVPLWPRVRAFWVVLFFFIKEIPAALDILNNGAEYRVAHWGHLGGFFGALSILFFLRPEAFRRYISHLPI